MTELVRNVKRLVGKGRFFTVECKFRSNYHHENQTETVEWEIYHEDMSHYDGGTMDQAFARFKEAWKQRKEKYIPQDTPVELAAAGAGPGETK